MVIPVGFLAGLATGAVAAALAALLWRRAGAALLRLRYLLAVGLLVSFALAAGAIYLAIGARSAATPATARSATGSSTGSVPDAGAAGSPAARSMELEANALATRLARQGGSDGDWTLLAQAYDFLGRAADAQRARAHIASAAVTPAGEMSPASLAAAAAATVAPGRPAAAAVPADARSWLALAEQRRTQQDYAGARAAYERAVELQGMTAQSWADYADVLGSLAGGSLAGAPATTAIDNALHLDPSNSKALWLKASQAHEAHQFSEALKWWRRLRAVLPPGSADARIIDANIAEAESLAQGTGAPAPAGSPGGDATAAQASGTLSGTVSLDARLRSRVPPGATLFIYAKAVDSPGPPLAVLRLSASSWPVSFQLDDSQAMLPARRLSQFDKVIVEARISRSGQAAPAAGDLYVRSGVVRPGAGGRLALVINQEIG